MKIFENYINLKQNLMKILKVLTNKQNYNDWQFYCFIRLKFKDHLPLSSSEIQNKSNMLNR